MKYLYSFFIVAGVILFQNFLLYIYIELFGFKYISSEENNIDTINFFIYTLVFAVIVLIFRLLKIRPFLKTTFSIKRLFVISLVSYALYIINSSFFNFKHSGDSTRSIHFIIFQIIILIISVLNEELLFRKFIIEYVNPYKRNLFNTILFSGLMFTLPHMQYLNYPLYLLLIFSIGFLAGVIYSKYGLFYSVLLHGLYNFFIMLRSDLGIDLGFSNQIDNPNIQRIIYVFILLLTLSYIIIQTRSLKKINKTN